MSTLRRSNVEGICRRLGRRYRREFGLGAVFAEQLAERGLSLVLAGRDATRLSRCGSVSSGQAPGVDVEVVVGDLGTEAGVEELITVSADAMSRLLVNNAGFGTYGPLLRSTRERDRDLVAVNVDALVQPYPRRAARNAGAR